MVTHSSILAWRIPWTEEPGGLQSMGCKELDTNERLTLSLFFHTLDWDCPIGSAKKNPPANAGDVGSISGLGRSPGGGGCAVFLPEESQ